jgi:hypothetical protein
MNIGAIHPFHYRPLEAHPFKRPIDHHLFVTGQAKTFNPEIIP